MFELEIVNKFLNESLLVGFLIKENSFSVCQATPTFLNWFVYFLHAPGNQKQMASYRTQNRAQIGHCIFMTLCVVIIDFLVHMHLFHR